MSTRLLLRFIIVLIAAWSLAAGLLLVAFQGASSGALGAGVSDMAGQRLVGAHMLLLVPVYLLLAWRFERYAGLHWLPFGGQLAVVLAVGYSIFDGDSDFEDGVLAVAVSAILASFYGFVWVTEQRLSSTTGDEPVSERPPSEPKPSAEPSLREKR
jgi:hypothetical protein